MYIKQASRPDLVFAVCMCARYQAKPTKKHLEAIKRIFRYLKGYHLHGVFSIRKDHAMSLTAYADADHAGIVQDSRRCTSRKSLSFLEIDLVSWSSKKAKKHGHSTTEAIHAMSGCLPRNGSNTYCLFAFLILVESKLIADIETTIMDQGMQCTTFPAIRVLLKEIVSFVTETNMLSSVSLTPKTSEVIKMYSQRDGNPARANIKQALGSIRIEDHLKIGDEMVISHSSNIVKVNKSDAQHDSHLL
ncbi:hypothetical protein Tco_0445071 [Tanacetum coccineum]